ncbi:hypothetical protein OESDEN_07709 [Oesophagostomum dentatum]|uniref:Uncharacterized protein n=1 Tax=Oesophagostomum dentatum TaxID=61180 RepID=A0A0B1T9A8_OESDE|nr:hypothetical protein OESDEN_07709 [Oesophagostomum dentatum]
MDLARQQVRSGIERLAEDSSNDNVTTVKLMAQNYLKNLPSECAFLKDVEEFNKMMEAEATTGKSEAAASSTAASVTEVTEAESASTEKSTESAEPKEGTTSAEQTEQTSSEHEHHDMSTASTSHEVSGDDLLSLFSIKAFVMMPVEGGLSLKFALMWGLCAATTPAGETEGIDGFIKAASEEIASGSATSTLFPVKELEEATLEILRTIPVPVEATTETKHIETNFGEDKTEFGMDVNSVDGTTTAPTEPVIVVDDASETVGENDIQAGAKEEVKSSSSAVLVFSSLLAAGAALLLV